MAEGPLADIIGYHYGALADKRLDELVSITRPKLDS
jgi:hypothetical protein